ncbi:MAG: malectin domain-containing carbohydrate-binding protein [Pseudomonadota bacterium]
MQLSGETKQWHKLTLDFEGPSLSETPETFMDHRLDVTFTHSDGTQITVPGYFAADGDAANTGATGGTVWRAHFNPPQTGDWTWQAAFRTGDDIAISTGAGSSAGFFDGDTGGFSVGATDKSGLDLRGKGMLEYNGDQYLNFAGTGEVFLKSGVGSPENFLAYSEFDATPNSHDYAPHVEDFNSGDPTWGGGQGAGIIGAVNYLADNGVNSAYMMLMNVGGDGRDVSPWVDQSLYDIKKNPRFVDLDTRAQVFDVSKLGQWEIVFEHMQEKGVNLHLFLQETENDQLLNNGDLGPERMIFMREMVARFGHHNGLTWNLGEENTNATQQITDHSNYLKSVDPYDHAVALHTYPNQHNKYEAYEGTETLDALSFQTSGDTQVPDLDRYLGGAEDAGRPVVAFLDEPGNAGTGLAAEGDNGWQTNHANMRETLWKFYAEGGSGAEWYYGYQTANGQGGDLAMEDFSLRESAYEWAASAREFFEQLPLEDMAEADNLTSGTETHGMAVPGEIYAYYLPDGGTATLNLSGLTGTYKIGWYDVIKGGDLIEGSVESVAGGGMRALGSAPTDQGGEWALMVWNTALYDFPVGESATDEPDAPVDDVPPPPDTPPPSDAGPEVTLRVVDTSSDTTIATFGENDVLDPSLIGAENVSIVADVSEEVGSVRLTLGGLSAVENVVPYALFGDIGGDFRAPSDAPFADAGDYSLKVELFANANAQGKIGEVTTPFSVASGPGDTGGGTPPPADPPVDTSPPADPPSSPSDATWIAQDGIVVIEAENGVISDPSDASNSYWALKDSLNGHTGEGYLQWEGPNFYSKPGEGALSYEFDVSEGGTYSFGLSGSRPKNGEASDLNNDFFVRMDGGEWKKVFFSGARESWNWGRTFDVNHQKSPAQYDLEPGKHTLEISGRSEDAFIDRIHLSLGGLNTNRSLEETLATDTPPQDPVPEDPNTPLAAVTTDFSLPEDGQISIAASDIAADADGDALSVSIVSQPGHGTLVLSNGLLIYTPEADFAGADMAQVEISDTEGGKTLVALDFDVDPVNDAPQAQDDSGGSVTAGEAFVIADVLSNDVDADGDALSIAGVEAKTDGFFDSLQVDDNGRIVGTLAAGATGSGIIEYTVSDGKGGTDTARVTIDAVAAEVPEEPETPEPPDSPEEPEDPGTPGSLDTLVQAINIGSKTAYTATDGTVFEADTTGVGRTYSADGAVAGTEDGTLYVTEAWGPNGLAYDFAIENGTYSVDLHFAEIWSPAFSDGVRVFDVEIEGQTIADDLDIFDTAGARAAYVITTEVEVSDGVLDIDLNKGVQNPKLSAIEIWGADAASSEPEPPEVPDAPEVPEVPETPETPEEPDIPDAPEEPELPEVPDTPDPEPPAEEPDGSVLSLVDTVTDETLAVLGERNVLHEGLLDGRSVSVAADVDETLFPAESAKMSLDGSYVRTENVEPYALFGDIERDYFGSLDLGDGAEHEVGVEYFAKDGGKGAAVGTDSTLLTVGGASMSGVENVEDVFAFDAGSLGDATISGFETGDRLAMLNGPSTEDLLASAIQQGDDLLIDFGGGNSLLLEDLAAAQMAREAAQEDPEADLLLL